MNMSRPPAGFFLKEKFKKGCRLFLLVIFEF